MFSAFVYCMMSAGSLTLTKTVNIVARVFVQKFVDRNVHAILGFGFLVALLFCIIT